MNTDLYTKTMLTLIVLFLGILSFDKVYDSFIREAEAKVDPMYYRWNCFNQFELDGRLTSGVKEVEKIANESLWNTMAMAKSGGDGSVFICGRYVGQ